MASNLDRYRNDLKRLKDLGFTLELRMQFDLFPEDMRSQLLAQKGMDDDKINKFISELPDFKKLYQKWYSESLALIKQIIPDRVEDFTSLYNPPKSRKEIKYGNYVLQDYVQGLSVTSYGEEVVGPKAGLPQFRIQRNILEAADARFESSLFDIVSMAQADLLDDEIVVARTLHKNKFARAAGAVAGVVLERHLKTVCDAHSITITKSHTSISTLNDALKTHGAIDVPQWRFIQHLGDIRNLCDHSKSADPTSEQVSDLIDGVAKVIKTVF